MEWVFLMIAGLILLVLLGKALFRPDNSRAATLMRTYRVMTPDLLSKTPDEQLVTAVVSNLLAKAEDANTDAYAVIPALSAPRCTVYSVWLFMRELTQGEPTALRRSGQFGFSELAADGLDELGCQELGSHLREYLQTADDALVPVMINEIEQCGVKELLVTYIRDNAAACCDE